MNIARALTATALVAAFLLGATFQFSSATQFISAGQFHSKIKPGSPAALAIADRPSEQNIKSEFTGTPCLAPSTALALVSLSWSPQLSILQLPFHLAQKATFFIRAP